MESKENEHVISYALSGRSFRFAHLAASAVPPVDTGITQRRSLSYRSLWSVLSAWSVLSVASAASLLSVGSFASILSIGSSNSVLSIGSHGGFLSIGAPRRPPKMNQAEEVGPATSDASLIVSNLSSALPALNLHQSARTPTWLFCL